MPCTGTRRTFLIPPRQQNAERCQLCNDSLSCFPEPPNKLHLALPPSLPSSPSISYLSLLCSHPLVVWPTIFCWHCVLCLIGTPAKRHTHTVPVSHTHTQGFSVNFRRCQLARLHIIISFQFQFIWAKFYEVHVTLSVALALSLSPFLLLCLSLPAPLAAFIKFHFIFIQNSCLFYGTRAH